MFARFIFPLLSLVIAACGQGGSSEQMPARDLPYSPKDSLVTQEEQLALIAWCENNSVLRQLDCESEVGKLALTVGFREYRGDEQCWVELFADKVSGQFGADIASYETRAQECTDLGVTRVNK